MVVYNSAMNNDLYNFTGLTQSADFTLNLWTIDFDIVDWDDDPLNYRWLEGEALESPCK